MHDPLISVVLPVHNGELYLKDAIQSILDQTYTNFELLILISFTTNKESLEIIQSFDDKRIKPIYRTIEENLPRALNKGIAESKGVYIARMDADDISLPQRFQSQVDFMENHPEISICGTWVKTFGSKSGYIKHPTNPEEIKASLLFQTSLVHPTVMFRKSDIEKYDLRYNPEFSYSEDAEMWAMSARKVKIYNMPQVLLLYRLHPKQATNVGKEQHSSLREKVKKIQLEYIGIDPTERELALHMLISSYGTLETESFLGEAAAWLERISQANMRAHYYDEKILKKLLGERWFASCYVSARRIGPRAIGIYFKYPLWKWFSRNPRNIMRFFKFSYKALTSRQS